MEKKLIDLDALKHYKYKQDDVVDKKIKVETDRAKIAENGLRVDVDLKATETGLQTEIARAKSAEAVLRTDITALQTTVVNPGSGGTSVGINTDVQAALDLKADKTNVGDLTTLTTTEKANLVGATNEIKGLTETNKQAIDTERTERSTKYMELQGSIDTNKQGIAGSARAVDLDREITRAKAEEAKISTEVSNKQQNINAKVIDKDGVDVVMFEKPITALDVSGNTVDATEDYNFVNLGQMNRLLSGTIGKLNVKKPKDLGLTIGAGTWDIATLLPTLSHPIEVYIPTTTSDYPSEMNIKVSGEDVGKNGVLYIRTLTAHRVLVQYLAKSHKGSSGLEYRGVFNEHGFSSFEKIGEEMPIHIIQPVAGVDPSRDLWKIETGTQVNKGSFTTHSNMFSAIVEENGLYVGGGFTNLISNNPSSGTGVDATYSLNGVVMTIVCTSDLVKSKFIVPFPDLAIKDATKYTLSWEVIEGEEFFDDIVINGANPPLTHIKDKKGSVTFERRSGAVDSSIHLTQASKTGDTVKIRLSLTETDYQVPFIGSTFEGGIMELEAEYRDVKYPKLYVNVDGTDYIEVGGKTISFANNVEGTAVVPSSYRFVGILMAFKEGTIEAKIREYLKHIKEGSYDVPNPMKGAYANIPRSTYKRGDYGSVEIVGQDSGKIPLSEKGAHNGVATLDANGKLPSSQLPAGVDEIREYDTLTDFPATGAGHIIYLALDTNRGYRWSGSTYIVLSTSIALGETSDTAYSGAKGKALRNEFDLEVVKTNKIKTDVMSLVDAERVARNTRDNEIESKIIKNIMDIANSPRVTDLDKEIARAKSKETSLTNMISANQTALNTLGSEITTEITRAKAEEAKIRQEVSSNHSTLDTSLQAEITRAGLAEKEINDKLNEKADSTSTYDKTTIDTMFRTEKHLSDALLGSKADKAALQAEITRAKAEELKKIPLSEKGAHNGVATLDANGKLPSSQLPAGVDEIKEYPAKTAFPATGTAHIIYFALDTNIGYRWSGSSYVGLNKSVSLGETSNTAYAGSKGAALRTELDAEVIRAKAEEAKIEGLIDLKEPRIIKKSGFNLEKSDSISNDSSNILATSKAVNTLVTALSDIETSLSSKENRFDKKSGFNLEKSDSILSTSSTTLATSKAVNDVVNAVQVSQNILNTIDVKIDDEITRAKAAEVSLGNRIDAIKSSQFRQPLLIMSRERHGSTRKLTAQEASGCIGFYIQIESENPADNLYNIISGDFVPLGVPYISKDLSKSTTQRTVQLDFNISNSTVNVSASGSAVQTSTIRISVYVVYSNTL